MLHESKVYTQVWVVARETSLVPSLIPRPPPFEKARVRHEANTANKNYWICEGSDNNSEV